MKKRFIPILVTLTLVAGLASTSISASESTAPAPAAATPPAPATAVVVAPEVDKALRDRVMARWDALISGDYEKSYGMKVPQYREERTLDEYKSAFDGFLMWQRAAVEKVVFVTPESADVRVAVNATMFPPSGGPDIETVTYLNEQWKLIDGQWWHASK